MLSPDAYRDQVSSFYEQTVADTYELYQRRLFESNAIDFDDMLMLTVEVLERSPEALARWQQMWRYVLVDEYQDTNHAQYRLLQLLAAEHTNVCVVGDPDQSIYAFRGADINNILGFEADFGDVTTVALEQNYRSTNRILEAANAVIDNNHDRKPKQLWSELGEGEPVRVVELEDEHAEARFVVSQIVELIEQGFSGAEIAVFYRTNAQSRVIEDLLARQQISYRVIGGPRFYERAEIKDAIAYLTLLVPTPPTRSVARPHHQPASPRDRRHHARAPAQPRRRPGNQRSGSRSGAPARGRAASGDRAQRQRSSSRRSRAVAAERDGLGASRSCSSCLLQRTGYVEALEAERTVEAEGRIENLQELVDRRARVRGARGRRRDARAVPARRWRSRPSGRPPRRVRASSR